MAALAELPYSMILGNIRMSGPGDSSQVVISPWPEIAGQLQIKHAVQALYEAGNAVAVIPETRQNYVPRLYAGLFFENRQIGFMKWQPIPTSIAGEANNTLSPIDAATSTSALRLFHIDKPTGLRDDTGVLVDKNDSRFKVKYMLFDRPASLRETFTAFLDAMAIAAPKEATKAGAFVNAVSVSGVVALNMHGTGYHSLLSWKLIVRTLLLLWEHGDFANEIDFEMAYDGIRIGEGFILNMPASRTSGFFSIDCSGEIVLYKPSPSFPRLQSIESRWYAS